MKVAVLYNEPVAGKPDSEDVLDEVNFVIRSLSELGYDQKLFRIGYIDGMKKKIYPGGGRKAAVSLNQAIFYLMFGLKKYRPDVIFNLVEGINDDPFYEQFLVLLLEYLNYPFTGSGYNTVLTTSDKSISKMLMKGFNILTPDFHEFRGIREEITVSSPWIVKPALENASVGIDESSVFYDRHVLGSALPGMYERHGRQPLIVEQYIQGREFNVSLLEKCDRNVEILPIAEIEFSGWPSEAPMIVGYKAKWDKTSFEYNHTARRFNPSDVNLDMLRSTALKCWKVFKLKGYARIDMRIADDNTIFVLEVNANPCISPDAGYIAALKEAGYSETYFVKTMIDVAMDNYE